MPKNPSELFIYYLSPADLQAYDRNARTHSKKQIRKIADSIQKFGFNNPVLIDDENRIIAGHGRVEAAKQLGLDLIPVIRLGHLTEDEMRAYIIADNRLAELAGWDKSILAIELQHLSTLALDFDLSLTGFDLPQIDFMIQEISENAMEVDVPPPNPEAVVTRSGDLWLLGDHRIICGNALKLDDYTKLLNRELAQLVFTDPPYNVPVEGHISVRDRAKHGNFAMAFGEMAPKEFSSFLQTAMKLMAKHSKDGSIHYVCMDWRHIEEVMAAGCASYAEFKNLCVWNKTNAGMGSLYRSKHELVFVWKNGSAPHINNIDLGKHGRYRSNVWDYSGQTIPHAQRGEELAVHPTVKPVAMVADALLDCSNRGGLVLDPFGGSGTTLIAAERTGRRARLIELEPIYVDVTIRRWQAMTGKQAIHASSGLAFDACTPSDGEG